MVVTSQYLSFPRSVSYLLMLSPFRFGFCVQPMRNSVVDGRIEYYSRYT